MTGRLFLMACMGDRFHSVRVVSQYKEILENEFQMCGFFATVTNSPIAGLRGGIYSAEFQLGGGAFNAFASTCFPLVVKVLSLDICSRERGLKLRDPRRSTTGDGLLQRECHGLIQC
jgi:hypothetical protein